MDGQVLAASLARMTQSTKQSVQALHRDSDQRDRIVRELSDDKREKSLEQVAGLVTDTQTNLGEIRDELNSFHAQLTTASDHINHLQDTLHTLNIRVKDQTEAEAQFSGWTHSATLSPSVVRTVLHTPIEKDIHAWVEAVAAIERQLRFVFSAEIETDNQATSQDCAWTQVRMVAEQSRLLAIARIRPHLISLLQPLRASVATSLPVLQFSVLLPHHQPLYQFLASQAPRAAVEVQLAYVNATRLYYETAFRRYVRELKRILARWHEATGNIASAAKREPAFPEERLQFAFPYTAKAPAVLAYLSEDVSYRASPEHIFHTFALVFSDTSCAEYAFLARFLSGVGMNDMPATLPPSYMLSLTAAEAEEQKSHQAVTIETWRQVMEPAIFYLQEFREAVLALPSIPVTALLLTITLTSSLLDTIRARNCMHPDLESIYMRHLLDAWPLVARSFDREVQALKLLVVGSSSSARTSSLLERWTGWNESSTDLAADGSDPSEALQRVIDAYIAMYTACARFIRKTAQLNDAI
ncbi:Vacuolar protein sorting-associated protein 52 [Malassezia yamatoensis]|uniref:Vacuolar protein sorting-associated protein 52 n=1 Tax=Malassezia yamatoensis TaxID=253288 RepID=A0AAJ5YPE5_9BASI|nr:Vacuolar protein sorting-associated protein 52 [Malassezia yamatoensis]